MTDRAIDMNEFEGLTLAQLETLYRAAVTLCRDETVAEDLVQTSCLKAMKGFSSFRQGTDFRAWLIRILRNAWYDELRSRERRVSSVPLDEQVTTGRGASETIVWSDAEDLLENFSDQQVIESLFALPEDQRLALFLVDVAQLGHRDVSEIMEVPVGTVKSRTSRARAALRSRLEDYALEYGFVGRE